MRDHRLLAWAAFWFLMAVLVLLTGCAAFDVADLQHTETLSQDTIIDTETLQDAGFTDEQIVALRESVKVEIKTTDSSAKVRGKPAGEFEMKLPGMELSVFDHFDPGELSGILYWIGGVSLILAALLGYLLGWGLGLIVAVFAISLIAVGRLMAASPWIAVLPGVVIFVGAGYVLWRLYVGKTDHKAVYDVADVLTDEQKATLPKSDRVVMEKNKGKSFFRRLV